MMVEQYKILVVCDTHTHVEQLYLMVILWDHILPAKRYKNEHNYEKITNVVVLFSLRIDILSYFL